MGTTNPTAPIDVDVAILGAGLAGLTLARQLLLNSDKTVLLLDRRPDVPGPRQKVGESTVQVGAYYFAKVLDLEEYLLHEQLMKYNLRFYWKSPGRDNDRFEDYGHSFIRTFSNIPCYQLDRNTFEAELLRRNRADPRLTFHPGAADLDVTLHDEGPHGVRFTAGGRRHDVRARWVVDTTGRGRFLARRLGLGRENPIRHGASVLWVDGIVDIDKLTDRPPAEVRKKRERSAIGHLPFWLATNHFMGEGFWFWVIPLRGKTSLGVVYDKEIFPWREVNSQEKLLEWVCREFPLFARDLPRRRVLDYTALKDFSYDCAQTISPHRWALAGEAGRFTDPLYSPGSDLISVYNTLITDAILTDDPAELAVKCRLAEQLMRVFYQATVPSYAVSYDALGDQEAFTLKYVWELSVYFPFYVFPFINDLFTDRRFLAAYMAKFARLGPINRGVQALVSGFYQWKKLHGRRPAGPVFNDFTDLAPLKTAESAFYAVGPSPEEAARLLDRHLANLDELARFVAAHVASVVIGDRAVLTNARFVEGIDVTNLAFDPEAIRAHWSMCADAAETYCWSFDPFVLDKFRAAPVAITAVNGTTLWELCRV
ncbi:MAG TPA: NAD(P)-binding protein [Gemmataceae bacterium]|jgi:flavin-dependent dehydrogenase